MTQPDILALARAVAADPDERTVAALRDALAVVDSVRRDILDPDTRVLRGAWGSVRLTRQLAAILTILLRHPGSYVAVEAMVGLLYDHRFDGGPDDPVLNIRTRICTIRRLIRQVGAPISIETAYGAGYRLEMVEAT